MKKTILILALVSFTGSLFAQKKTTTSATIIFDATTEKDAMPKAENKTVVAALNTQTGAVQFEAVVKNFAFSNPMMQDHFNGSQWLNSDKWDKFTFKGKINDLSKVNFTKDGSYTMSVTGDLTIRDISKSITAPATITVKDGVIDSKSDFIIALADYNITSTQIDAGKVSKTPKVTVSAQFK